ncbi:hypothetical protein J2X20_003193 [Pelomonas saccharophila]|uniref:DUF3592 domain-containing protein n=1 Tax=Roseateles saccharophilus TaxID=304 RepID=A0ABU1YNU6_ROSSA|nr:DUF3592 domain-containing protein [Roseateles saccharophilus]MDR7270535.1 hypothetical protein [Roseateles saccharophilus]
MLSGLRSWIFLLALLIGGPYVMFSGASDARDIKRLQANGRETMAVVESIEWRKKRSGSESGFRGHIVFKTEAGNLVNAEIGLPQQQGQAMKDGKADPVVKVRYLPNEPNVVRLADMQDNTSETRWIGAVMFLIGLALLIWRWRKSSAGPATAAA